ncbi:MAG: amphi-Trp domain-containing protein, partial [Alphaproteobacteria bacterium]|nr:amphi-Trp domain-containing protein [Alphaproteobacteria bacterium]
MSEVIDAAPKIQTKMSVQDKPKKKTTKLKKSEKVSKPSKSLVARDDRDVETPALEPVVVAPVALPDKRRKTEDKSIRTTGKADCEFDLARDEAAAYLEALAEGLRTGSISIKNKKLELTLTPAPNLSLNLKGK